MTFGKYSIIVLGAAALSQAVLLPLLSEAVRPAVALGAALAVANVLLAFALAAWGIRRSPRVFLGAVLGGMMVRLALVLLAVALAVAVFDYPKVPLAMTLLSYFVPLLVFELAVLHRSTPAPAVTTAVAAAR
ncbi:MAG TPA: hypothetical protein VI589_06630 [Vicinamibacteria bacterium]